MAETLAKDKEKSEREKVELLGTAEVEKAEIREEVRLLLEQERIKAKEEQEVLRAQMVLQAAQSQEREIALTELYLEISRLKAEKAASVASAEEERKKVAERRAEIASAAAAAAIKSAELAATKAANAAAAAAVAAAAELERKKEEQKKKEEDRIKEEERKKEEDRIKEEERKKEEEVLKLQAMMDPAARQKEEDDLLAEYLAKSPKSRAGVKYYDNGVSSVDNNGGSDVMRRRNDDVTYTGNSRVYVAGTVSHGPHSKTALTLDCSSDRTSVDTNNESSIQFITDNNCIESGRTATSSSSIDGMVSRNEFQSPHLKGNGQTDSLESISSLTPVPHSKDDDGFFSSFGNMMSFGNIGNGNGKGSSNQ